VHYSIVAVAVPKLQSNIGPTFDKEFYKVLSLGDEQAYEQAIIQTSVVHDTNAREILNVHEL
jgi:hypothetical protein